MTKGFLRIAVLAALLLALNPSLVFADEADYEHIAYEVHENAAFNDDTVYLPEPPAVLHWQQLRAPFYSEQEFFLRVGGEIYINQFNERSWLWIADPDHMRNLQLRGFDMSFFLNIDDAISFTPQLEYMLETWNWDVEIFMQLDKPTINFVTAPHTRIEFDFFAESLMVLSWGGEALREVEMVTGIIGPGASVTLPGGPSLTAIYVGGAYGPSNRIERGHMLLLIEVLGEDGARAPAYSFNPQDHIPSEWAAGNIYRAMELGILPEGMDRSFRRPIRRLDFATLVVSLYENGFHRNIAGNLHFNDTDDINAEKIGFLGIMVGDDERNFIPAGQLTREQGAVALTRLAAALGMYLPVVDGVFADAYQIAEWAQEAALRAFGAGILTAPEGYFEPTRPLTREEAIVMMVRLLERS